MWVRLCHTSSFAFRRPGSGCSGVFSILFTTLANSKLTEVSTVGAFACIVTPSGRRTCLCWPATSGDGMFLTFPRNSSVYIDQNFLKRGQRHPHCAPAQESRSLTATTHIFTCYILDFSTLTLYINMRVTILALTGALLTACSTSATPLKARQDSLLPFEVTRVSSRNPPGVLGPHPCKLSCDCNLFTQSLRL